MSGRDCDANSVNPSTIPNKDSGSILLAFSVIGLQKLSVTP